MRSRRRKWGRLAGALAALVLAAWLATVAAVVWVGNRDEARPAAAIVVLGAAQYDGRPSPVLRARLDHAIALWRRGLAPTLIVTGGVGVGDTTSEAAVGRRYAMQRGVPGSAIMLENQGLTTSQSLRSVRQMLDSVALRRVLLVSDPFHMLRLRLLARRMGLVPFTSPTRTSPISASPAERWQYVLSESIKTPLALLFEHGD